MAIEQKVRRREVEGLELFFYAHDELILRYKGTSILFHCWGLRNRKDTFRVFRKALQHQKKITFSQVFLLAEKHDVRHTYGSNSKVRNAIANGTVVELAAKGRRSNR